MSENIPESIPTSADPRSKRPTKKRALTPSSAHASQVEALFAKPDQPINLPSGAKPRTLAAPPEIVANVQGSSAGAGSGEFHVYKASRRREYERLRQMDEEVKREKAEEGFVRKKEELSKRDEEKTGKNRKRREKMKARRGKEKEVAGIDDGDVDKKDEGDVAKPKSRIVPMSALNGQDDGDVVDAAQDGKVSEEKGLLIHDEE